MCWHLQHFKGSWNGVGNPVYPPARRELAKHGISCEGKRARQVNKEDYNNFDYLICMDKNNINSMKCIIGEDTEGKISLLLDYTESRGKSIADPWYTGNFEITYSDVFRGCEVLLDYLLQKNRIYNISFL